MIQHRNMAGNDKANSDLLNSLFVGGKITLPKWTINRLLWGNICE